MFEPGERVIALGALTQSAGIAAGIVAGALSAWHFKKPWYAMVIASFAGALIAFVITSMIARTIYSPGEGQVTIAKLGTQSLVATIPAGLVGGLSSAVAIGIITALIFASTGHMAKCLAIGVTVGVIWALLGSLL